MKPIEDWVETPPEAAEEIRRLRAEVKELRTKLDKANDPTWELPDKR